MKLGFTGTREGLTDAQQAWLETVFDSLDIDVLHHGACVGADLAAHQLAAQHDIPIIVWPPIKTKFLAPQCLEVMAGVTIMPAAPYLMRDRAIAGACEGLVACPKNREPTGLDVSAIGGTWYTINFATRLGKEVAICYPGGEIEKRETKILRRPME